MEYMPIVPIGMFDVLEQSICNSVFILPQHWGNAAYRKFYQDTNWENVIIDNALYEETKAFKFADTVEIARTLSANQIFCVGPEKLTDGIETAYMTIDILSELETEGYITDNTQMMMILHQHPNEMRKQYEMVRKYRDLAIGVSIFSARLGYDRSSLLRHVGDHDLGRMVMSSAIDERFVHAFGWDDVLELYNLRLAGFDTIDSSIAITAAINGIDLLSENNLTNQWRIPRGAGREGVLQSTRAQITETEFKDAVKWQALENINMLCRKARGC